MDAMLAGPLFLVMFAIAGVISILFMLFSQVYLVIQLCLFLPAKILPHKFKNFYYWTLCSSSIFLWISIFVSRHSLANTSVLTECSTAGFPFKVFTFPCGAMGGDYVPREMWLPFYLNYFLWLVFGVLLSLAISRFKFADKKKAMHALYFAYAIINLLGLGMVFLAFD
jgi:hypothetical protein